MKTATEASPHSLTFFEPLKDENSISNSGLLQSFLDLFNAKKSTSKNLANTTTTTVQKSQNVDRSLTDVPHVPAVLHYKVPQTQKEPQDASSSAQTLPNADAGTSSKPTTVSKPRAFSSQCLTEDALSRPHMLNVQSYYNVKDSGHGSEVELRMKNLSNLFKDLPRKMGKSAQDSKDPTNSVQAHWDQKSLRQYWMPDEQCHECYECNERFTTFRRRHHCRICGHIFCSRCCYQLISGQIIGYPGMIRICTYCYKLVMSDEGKTHDGADMLGGQTTEQDGNSEMHRDREPSIITSNAVPFSRGMLQQRIGRTKSMVAMRSQSPAKEEATKTPLLSPPSDFQTSAYDMFDVTPSVTPGPRNSYQSDQVNLAKQSTQLHSLWVRMNESEDRIDFRDHRFRLRKFSHTVSGEDLVEWLLSHQISDTRDQACLIGQALLDAELIGNVSDIKERLFHEENIYCERKSIEDVHKYLVDVDPDITSPISIPTGHRVSFEVASSLDAGNEPNWVREIDVEETSDVSSSDDVEENKSWGSAFSTLRSAITQTPPYVSDEYSSSPLSGASLSSYIEIDNKEKVIKYNRRSFTEDSKSRKEALDLQEPRFVDESETEIDADYIRGYLSWHGAYSNSFSRSHSVGWRENDLYNSTVTSTAKQTYFKLQKLYYSHSMRFLDQLFKSKQLDPSWNEIIVPLAKRISESVVPNCEANMDVGHYVHVKKLLDGPPQDSRIVNGVVFTKNVVSSNMRTRIDNPVIMLLATPLEYQRVHHKFASLDPIVRQEPEFFKNLVSRILKHQPDIVISQCSVAHVARRLLQNVGITLVINVKKSVMERLSRCTGAEIVRSVDQIQNVRLGTCARFRVLRHYDGKRKLVCNDGPQSAVSEEDTSSFKTMIYLDGCRLASGCTVLLRNNPDYSSQDADSKTRTLLSDVKSVFLLLVQIMYHCKLELSYLMDQQDLVTSGIPNPAQSGSVQTVTPAKSDVSVISQTTVLEKPSDSGTYRERTDTTDTSASFLSDCNTITTDQLLDENDLESSRFSENCFLDGLSFTDTVIHPFQCSEGSSLPESIHSAFRTTLLSYSPLTPVVIPFLLGKSGKSSPLYKYLPELLYWSEKFPKEKMQTFFDQKHRSSSNVERKNSMVVKDQFLSRTTSKEDFPTTERIQNDDVLVHSTHFKSIHNDEKHPTEVDNSLPSGNALEPRRNSTSPALHSQGGQVQYTTTSNHAESPQDNKTLKVEENPSGYQVEEEGRQQKAAGEKDGVEWIPHKHPFLTASFSKPVDAKEMQDLLADFRANGSSLRCVKTRPPLLLNSKMTSVPQSPAHELLKAETPLDCLALANHQHIFVLFSSYSPQSPNAPYPCVIPWAVDIDFYKGNDITFGGFLERYCFRPSYHCPNSACNRPMVEHVRSFVHGNVCMNIVLKELSKPVLIPEILSWCWNSDTKTSTDLRALSQDARSMSFAKYLELRLQTFFPPDGESAYDVTNEMEIPPFTSYQYFLYKDIVAAFKCFPIRVYDISLPPHQVLFRDATNWMKVEEGAESSAPQYQTFVHSMNELSKIGYESMDAIKDMILTSRSNNPFEVMSGSSDSPELDEEINSLKSKRETHFGHLMAVYKEERARLRDCIDRLHLDVQSLRIRSDKQDDADDDIENQEENLQFPDSSTKITASEDVAAAVEETAVVLLNDNIRSNLSAKFLELTCLINLLVHTWNTRINAVVEQDRQSRKMNRINNYDLYGNQPLALQSASFGRSEKAKNLPTLEESHDEDDNALKDYIMVDGNLFAKSPPSDNLNTISQVATNELKQTSEGNKTSQRKNDEAAPPAPVPPNRGNEKGALRKASRAASTMNMKFLMNQFLSSSNQTQVRNPFPLDEHYLLPNCSLSGVVVRDGEPTSIIAYTLKSPEYEHFIASDVEFCASKSNDSGLDTFASLSTESQSSSNLLKSSTSHEDIEIPDVTFRGLDKTKSASSTPKNGSLSVTAPPSSIGSSPIPSPPQSPALNSPHLEVQFKDSTTKFYCKVYFASRFKTFRQLILNDCEDSYISSLSRCIRWAARGGKSGSAFHKSLDDRLVIKQMSRFELESFLDVAQHYIDYVTEALRENRPTALSKILGVYRISYKNSSSSRTFKQDVLVMENLFYQKNIKQVFDLKGSVRNRHVKTESVTSRASPTSLKNIPNSSESVASSIFKSDLVLLDENLLRIMRDRPLYVYEHTKVLIKCALSDDAKFLANHYIIDYSLLVGIDNDKQEIVVGIIDYLRTFTWDKKIEMVVKSYGMIGRQGTRSMPTVVSPEMYRTRFCEAMERYFQVAPDRWYGLHSYEMPKKTETSAAFQPS